MIEREIKLSAEAAIVLPDLTDAVPGLTVGPKSVLQLDAVYYDTATLSLARWGVTLRSRSGEPGAAWTLKLPESAVDAELSRHELTFDEPIGSVPNSVRLAARACARSQPLGPVVRLSTERTQFVLELDGRSIATLCDDTVVADGAPESVSVFREIEVELAEGAPDAAVTAILSRLRDSGCKDDEAPVPKAIRALGPRAFDPPDVVVPKARKKATVGVLVRHTLATSVTELIEHHPLVCVGDDPEAVHQFRVAARRLRSDLRTFAPLLDRHLTTWLRDELQWLGTAIGRGRDADVLAERLRSQVSRLPARDAKSVDLLLQRLAETGHDAHEHIVATFEEDRYVVLLDALVEAAREPKFAAEPSGLADRAARPIVLDIVRKTWRRLDRAVEALAPDAPDTAYHAIRIRSKRARYAVEAVTPVFGKGARQFARAIADVQTVLGQNQDTTVAEAWLREAAKGLPSTRLVAGELIAFERDDRVGLRAKFWKVWKRTSRRKLRKWMK
jgi:CHAD domain-containing protein